MVHPGGWPRASAFFVGTCDMADITDALHSPQIPPDRVKVQVMVVDGTTGRADAKSWLVDRGVAYTGGINRMASLNALATLMLLGLGGRAIEVSDGD